MPSGDVDTDNDEDNVAGGAKGAIFGSRGEIDGLSDDGAVMDE